MARHAAAVPPWTCDCPCHDLLICASCLEEYPRVSAACARCGSVKLKAAGASPGVTPQEPKCICGGTAWEACPVHGKKTWYRDY